MSAGDCLRLFCGSQCDFCKSRGYTDIIFATRYLMGKECSDHLFVLRAYDSIPRSALWTILGMCSVAPKMWNIIRNFYKGMYAEVCVVVNVSDKFDVGNGLRAKMHDTLNIYFNAVVTTK